MSATRLLRLLQKKKKLLHTICSTQIPSIAFIDSLTCIHRLPKHHHGSPAVLKQQARVKLTKYNTSTATPACCIAVEACEPRNLEIE